MKNIPLADCTRRMGAPADWNHAEQGICHTIEICDREGWMMSGWQLSEAEIERLRNGGHLWLSIQGTCHPVISLQVA